MLDDLRHHDPRPTEEERRWMDTEPLGALLHVAVIAIIALAIALSATVAIDPVYPSERTAATR
jgi:hypothetical protein